MHVASLLVPIRLPKSFPKYIQPTLGAQGTRRSVPGSLRTLKMHPKWKQNCTQDPHPAFGLPFHSHNAQNGSRPSLGHMEPPEACPGPPGAPNDSQHGSKTPPNTPVHYLALGTILICASLFSKSYPCHNVDCKHIQRRKELPQHVYNQNYTLAEGP